MTLCALCMSDATDCNTMLQITQRASMLSHGPTSWRACWTSWCKLCKLVAGQQYTSLFIDAERCSLISSFPYRQQCKIAISLLMMLWSRPVVSLDFIHDRLNSDCIPSQCYSIPTRPPQQFQQASVVQQKLSHGCFQDFPPCWAVFEILHRIPAVHVSVWVLLHVMIVGALLWNFWDNFSAQV